ncbi:MAG: SGNH/GDSL hydrolase family protein, partial [Kiritimatiellia bacterium]
MRSRRIALLAAGLCLAGAGVAAPFTDGDRVVFWGDSITHGGLYPKMVADYYLTRYPDRAVRFYNAGVGGDNAGAAMTRFEEDVQRWNPTVVTLMFGMNDSGRGMYDPKRMADAAYRAGIPAREKACFDNYATNMTRLVQRLRADAPQARLMFLTPTPYDETAVQKGPNPTPALKGAVAALKRFADFGRQTAAETGSEVVDWNTSYQNLVVAEQRRNPEFSFVRPDRVHPMAPGHLFMTYEFLKAQGATNPVSDVAISARDGAVARSLNATVSDFAKTADGCAFTVLERALPWPIQKDAEAALPLARILEDLNRETLAVRDLAPGARYALFIDGEEVGAWTAGELGFGINLARNPRTPQFKQAAEVERKNAERCAIERNELRMFAASRWYLRLRKVNPDDFAAVQAHYDGLADKNGYFERRLPDYIRTYGKKAELEKDQDARWSELLKLRVPKVHRYELRRLPAVNPDAAPQNPTVRHIQRTMKALAESTVE